MSHLPDIDENEPIDIESIHVDETISQTQTKRSRQSKKRSDVWNHFEEFKDGKGATKSKCNHCGKEYFSSSRFHGTSSLRNHLTQCGAYKATLSDTQTHLTFQEEKLVSWKFDQNVNRKALVEMIIEDELPFSFVEGKGFRKYSSISQPHFKIPCRSTVTEDVLKMFYDHKQVIYDLIKRNKSRVCLTTDSWTSIEKANYMTLTVHFIDNEWRLTKKVLNFCLLDSHRGVDIGKAIEICLLDWGIDSVLTISVDNASSNDVAIDYLKKKFASWPKCVLKGKWIHIRCVAHILNLIVQDGIAYVGDSINNIRGAVKWIRNSSTRISSFKKYAEI